MMKLTVIHLTSLVVAVGDIFAGSLPGGYGPVEVGKETMAAAQFATKQESLATDEPVALDRILQAEQQIVAGVNYRLVLIVKKAGVNQKARAVVFRDLNSKFFLKSWEWLDSH